MTTAVLIFVFALWPLLSFAGGLGFSSLAGLAGLALITSAKDIRFRSYIPWLVVLFGFAAVSALWSPNSFSVIEFRPLQGDVNLRSEVLRVGLLFVALAILFAAVRKMDDGGRVIVNKVAVVALSVQLLLVALLAIFEEPALELFAPLMSSPAEGVQNISRNSLIMAAATPWLFFAIREWRPDRVGEVLSWGAVAVIAAALLWRGVHAGLLAIVLAVAAVAVVRLMPRYGFRVLAGVVALLTLLTPFIFGLIAGGADANVADSSMEWRRAIWSRVLEIVAESPIYGGGLGVLRSISEVISTGVFAGDKYIPNHAHNMFVQLWAETGAAGAVLTALVVMLVGWRLPAPERLGVPGQMAAGVVGAIVAISGVSFDLWNDWWWAVCGLLLVLVSVSVWQSQTQAEEEEPDEAFEFNTDHVPVKLTHDLSNNFNLLRLLFASSVAIYHMFLLGGIAPDLTREGGALAVAAGLGVHGFFVLSGYLVYASCERSRSTLRYAFKRFRRLYPAYFVVILASVAGALIFSPEARANQYTVLEYLGWNLLFLNFLQPDLPGLFSGGEITAVNGALWTLKIEVMFYMILPLLVWAFHKAGKYRWLLAGAIYLGSEAWRLTLLGADDVQTALSPWYDTLAYQLPGQMRFFICGIVLYWLRRDRNLILWMAPFGMAALSVSLAMPDQELLRPVSLAVVVIWFGLIVPRVVNVVRYGDVSYGLYIVHFPIAQSLVSVGGSQNAPAVYLYAAISMSLAVALFLWWTIERPFLHRDSAYRMTSRDPENVLPLFKYKRKREEDVATAESPGILREGA